MLPKETAMSMYQDINRITPLRPREITWLMRLLRKLLSP
jgi:hypothetical protein